MTTETQNDTQYLCTVCGRIGSVGRCCGLDTRIPVNDCSPPTCSHSVATCVYCGHEYPEGTPTAKHDLLTAHIKVCEKHPMREAEARIERLRKALAGLIGAETKKELESMEAAIRMMPGFEADKIAGINAIHALLFEANSKITE